MIFWLQKSYPNVMPVTYYHKINLWQYFVSAVTEITNTLKGTYYVVQN